jgi:hypothetical protein
MASVRRRAAPRNQSPFSIGYGWRRPEISRSPCGGRPAPACVIDRAPRYREQSEATPDALPAGEALRGGPVSTHCGRSLGGHKKTVSAEDALLARTIDGISRWRDFIAGCTYGAKWSNHSGAIWCFRQMPNESIPSRVGGTRKGLVFH